MTMNLKQIDTAIASIAKRGKALRKDAHTVLVGIIDHYIDNGDYTRLEKLQKVVDTTFGRSALKAMNQWVEDFVTSLTWDKEVGNFVHIKGVTKEIRNIDLPANEKKDLPAFSGSARDWPFFNMEVKTDPKPFVLADSFRVLLNRAQKAYEDSIANGPDLKLKAQIEILQSLHLEDVAPVEEETVPEAPAEIVRPKTERKVKAFGELVSA